MIADSTHENLAASVRLVASYGRRATWNYGIAESNSQHVLGHGPFN